MPNQYTAGSTIRIGLDMNQIIHLLDKTATTMPANSNIIRASETSASQELRGLQYKIDLAVKNIGTLPSNTLATVFGATPTVNVAPMQIETKTPATESE